MIISGTSLVAGCTTHAWLLLNVTGYVKNLHADVVDHCLRAVRIRSFSMTAVFLARGHIYSVPVLVLPHFRDGCKFWGRGTSVGLLAGRNCSKLCVRRFSVKALQSEPGSAPAPSGK